MIDIIMTTYNRVKMLRKSVESIVNKTSGFRLTISDDCSNDGTREYLAGLHESGIASVILKDKREGVVPGFNGLWDAVKDDDSQYVCYLQDDAMPMEQGWLQTLIQAYEDLRGWIGGVGFFSGSHLLEHPVRMNIIWRDRTIYLKKSSGATNLIATKDFWKSVGVPIPLVNPNGTVRGFPDHGIGSQIDLWFTGCQSGSRQAKWAASPNCSFKQGKKVLVIPGLVKHIGDSESCWRSD